MYDAAICVAVFADAADDIEYANNGKAVGDFFL